MHSLGNTHVDAIADSGGAGEQEVWAWAFLIPQDTRKAQEFLSIPNLGYVDAVKGVVM